MTSIGVLQIAIFLGLILVCTKPLGAFMAKLFEGSAYLAAPGSTVARSPHVQASWRERKTWSSAGPNTRPRC